MNSIALTLLQEQLEGIAQEMGSALSRAAFSPNIRVRRDFSCALFSAQGELLAQAAHIPVHLGSMPAQVRRLVETRTLRPGELYLGNDPFDGGTHLPDLTLLQPVFRAGDAACLGVAAVRAHHADIGGTTPGSMSSQADIYGEGLRIPLLRIAENEGPWNRELMTLLLANMRCPSDREGDLLAQSSACRAGAQGLLRIVEGFATVQQWEEGQQAMLGASRKLAASGLASLLRPGQEGQFSDLLECDGQSLPIAVRLSLDGQGRLLADFQGTAPQVAASFNATLPITRAAVAYVISCLLDEPVPVNEGLLDCFEVKAPLGSLVHARYPAAVAAGNVETSQRIVDVLFGALHQLLPTRIPAASAGSMNNLSFGFASGGVHYETAGGGCGGTPLGPGASALQVHMTNTRSTPVEILESEFPVTVLSHRLRSGSGGKARHRGGEGTRKHLEFAESVTLTLMATRRSTRPYGLEGGGAGQPGRQATRLGDEAEWSERSGSFTLSMPPGGQFLLETPGGGGWGAPIASSSEATCDD